jgi:hypothetical protein
MQLLGKNAQELNPLIQAGADGLAKLTEEARKNGAVVSTETVTALDGLSDRFAGLKLGLQAIGMNLGGVFAPLFEGMLVQAQMYLVPLGQAISTYLAKPETQAIIQGIADAIGNFAKNVVAWLPTVIVWFQEAFGWLGEHQGLIIGALTAIGVAIAAFVYTTVIPSAIAVVTATYPIVLAMAAITAAVWLVYEAWTNNWGGIRDTLMGWWAAVQPILMQVVQWFQVNIPVAIQALVTWWNTVLIPALQTAWGWFQTNLLPVLQQIGTLLGVTISTAVAWLATLWQTVLLPAIQSTWAFIQTSLWPLLQALGDFLGAVFSVALTALAGIWQSVLLPAIQVVWGFISGSLWPLFQAVGNFLGAVFGVALTALAGIWQNVLLPAIQVVCEWIGSKLQPIFEAFSKFVSASVMPVIMALAGWFRDNVAPAIQSVADVIETIIDWLNNMATLIKNMKLPPWMTPGSPTPWEMGLRGVAEVLDDLNQDGLPQLNNQLAGAMNGLTSDLGLAVNAQVNGGVSTATAGTGTVVNLNIGTLVADQSGLEALERSLKRIRGVELARSS